MSFRPTTMAACFWASLAVNYARLDKPGLSLLALQEMVGANPSPEVIAALQGTEELAKLAAQPKFALAFQALLGMLQQP